MYRLDYTNTLILRQNADGSLSCIPLDPSNGDYAVYLAWRQRGNTPDPADPAPLLSPTETADLADLAAFPTRVQITDAVGRIQTDLGTLGGTPTSVQVVAILTRALQRELYEIKSIAALVKKGAV